MGGRVRLESVAGLVWNAQARQKFKGVPSKMFLTGFQFVTRDLLKDGLAA